MTTWSHKGPATKPQREQPLSCTARGCCPAGPPDASANELAIGAADRAFPSAVAELGVSSPLKNYEHRR